MAQPKRRKRKTQRQIRGFRGAFLRSTRYSDNYDIGVILADVDALGLEVVSVKRLVLAYPMRYNPRNLGRVLEEMARQRYLRRHFGTVGKSYRMPTERRTIDVIHEWAA